MKTFPFLKELIIGKENDILLLEKLKSVLKEMGAEITRELSGLAGSQEYAEYTVDLKGEKLTIELETYIGISLKGPSFLVDEILDRMP